MCFSDLLTLLLGVESRCTFSLILHPGVFAILWEEKTKALFQRVPDDPETQETSGFLGKA